MKKLFITAAAGTLLFILTGCAPKLVFSASDLTVRELEKKMAATLDPRGRFASAQRFIQRFEVKTFTGLLEPPTEEFVEVKFAAPGKFKITTSDSKGIHYGYIFNDASGHMVDYRSKTVKVLDKEGEEIDLKQNFDDDDLSFGAIDNAVGDYRDDGAYDGMSVGELTDAETFGTTGLDSDEEEEDFYDEEIYHNFFGPGEFPIIIFNVIRIGNQEYTFWDISR